MRAVLADRPGGPEVLTIRECPDPVAGPGEVRVRIRAAGVNRADVLQRQGHYPPPPGQSPILGLELAWVLVDDAPGLPAGSRVMALVGGGAYAEMAVVPVVHLLPVPTRLSFEEAAAIPEAFLTAYHNLFDLGGLFSGETVLIHAAASGVGTAAVQLARLAGARVLAAARTASKLEQVQDLGADTCICTGTESFAERVEQETGGGGVNLILDFVGGSYWEDNIRSLARCGRMALIGTLGGSRATIDIGALMRKRLRVEGSTLRGQTLEEKAGLVRRASPMILKGLEDGSLRPVLDRVFPLEEAAGAHRYMESNQNTGKIVLHIGDVEDR